MLLASENVARPSWDGQKSNYRDYAASNNRIKLTYSTMHKNQTVDFVRNKMAEYEKFDHAELTMMEVLEKLNDFVDESDPDTDLPNIIHAFQTAERLRQAFPNRDWLHLVGLIHDAGKILHSFGEPQWCVVGDTYPVGCAFEAEKIVFGESFQLCSDFRHPVYSTKYGIYTPNCGLDNVLFSWGHDQYLYQVLKNHPHCSIPEEGLYYIRFHSFYPWHREGCYMHLCDQYDFEMVKNCQIFSSFDLYSKTETLPDIEMLKPYYTSLIEKYLGEGKINW